MAPRIKSPPLPKPPKRRKASEFVMKAPRIKPETTRNYGKGGTPLSNNMFSTAYGAGIGETYD